jgi:hypothetical protein
LRACLRSLAERTEQLLSTSDVFADLIRDTRLGLEVAVINRLAHRLTGLLAARDPLSNRVHLGKGEVLGLTAATIITRLLRFPRRRAMRPSL